MKILLLCVLCISVANSQSPSLDKGLELVRQQKYEQARSEFEAVLKADPGNGRAVALLAAMEMQTGYVKTAIARLEILLEKDPQNPDLHELLGQGYMTAQDWPKAEKEWRWMTTAQPESDQAHMQLALALMERDQFEPALISAGRALEINPKRGDAHSLRGNILASLGRMDEASQEWTVALLANAGDTVALSGLAVYWQNRDPNRALDHAKRAVDLSGGNALGPLRVLAMVYRARGETEEARKALERARLKYPDNQVVAAELRALGAPATGTGRGGVPPAPSVVTPPPPPPIPGLTGLTLGTVVQDLMPLVGLPRRPTAPVVRSTVAPLPPSPPPASTAGLRGLTLGAIAADLMPLVKPPQRPSALRPAAARDVLPVLPLFMNAPVFIYSDVVRPPTSSQKK